MLNGLNHITYVVRDLDTSYNFYTKVLGMKPKAKWKTGAYLSLGNLWFCLNVDDSHASVDYSHVAFDILQSDFLDFETRVKEANVKIWKENTSEGNSLYILDPDNHKLEIHVGCLQTRMDSMETHALKNSSFIES